MVFWTIMYCCCILWSALSQRQGGIDMSKLLLLLLHHFLPVKRNLLIISFRVLQMACNHRNCECNLIESTNFSMCLPSFFLAYLILSVLCACLFFSEQRLRGHVKSGFIPWGVHYSCFPFIRSKLDTCLSKRLREGTESLDTAPSPIKISLSIDVCRGDCEKSLFWHNPLRCASGILTK